MKTSPFCQAFIEVSQGSSVKYEWDHTHKVLYAARTLPENYFFPVNYGFIPKTLASDGDELDIFVFSSSTLLAPSIVSATVVGVLEMTDKGVRDDKIIAYMQRDAHWKYRDSLEKWPSQLVDQLHIFYKEVKRLESKAFEFLGFKSSDVAVKLISDCSLKYEEKAVRQ